MSHVGEMQFILRVMRSPQVALRREVTLCDMHLLKIT